MKSLMTKGVIEKNLILTGFMACGKTTVGQLLARQCHCTFIDTDALIVEQAEMSISEIFATRGEEAFRQMERQTAAALADRRNLVIATGGKMMLDPANVEALGSTGVIVCLTASPKEICRRVVADGLQLRPLLTGPDPEGTICKLLEARKAGYGQFPQVMTDGKTPEMIAEEVLSLVTR